MICFVWVLLLVVTFAVITLPRHTRPPERCGRCGYNLTGNISGICPECGTPVATPGGAAQPDRRRLASWVAPALLTTGIAIHAAFVVTFFAWIRDPAASPYGHADAFGNAPDWMSIWCLGAPAVAGALSAVAVLVADIRERNLYRPRHPILLRTWMANVAWLVYLSVIAMTWFSD